MFVSVIVHMWQDLLSIHKNDYQKHRRKLHNNNECEGAIIYFKAGENIYKILYNNNNFQHEMLLKYA